VPGRVLFREDFFERVIDVNWESEPKVYWVAGTGHPNIVNGMPGDNHGYALTSEDGKHWKGIDLFKTNGQGIGPLYTGCWLREGLQEGNHPVWMMAGGTSETVCSSCACYTDTGTDFNIANRTVFDERHACDSTDSASNLIFVGSHFTFPDFHKDFFRSPNGRQWQPKSYHGGEGGGGENGGGEEAFAALSAAPNSSFSPVAHFVSADPADPKSPLIPVRRSLLMPTPLAAEGSGGDKKADQIVFQGSTHIASGKVKKGPFSGKKISVEIKPYHSPPEGGAHGDATVEVKVVGDDKTEPKTINTGVARSIAVGYGYYTFVVGGSSGSVPNRGQRTTLAWSEDGVQWKKVEMGLHSQVNPICVGPRPKKA
jgi:hypothetical protein